MLRYLRLKKYPQKVVQDPGGFAAKYLISDPCMPATLKMINELPEGVKRRIYRALIPPHLLTLFNIDPVSWQPRTNHELILNANRHSGTVHISITSRGDSAEEFFCLQLMDNALNGVDLVFLLISDPACLRFGIDLDAEGRETLFGTARRNPIMEEQAKQAGLAPGQVRKGLAASSMVLKQIEVFLSICGHKAYFLEPLTYASACLFERRGFAYVRGHKLMEDINREFQPGGGLHRALDGSTPFRQPDQWSTVRGRAWAIHDGLLKTIDASWDNLRMIKQVGRHAGVETFPKAPY